MRTGLLWENLNKKYSFKDQDVDRRIILKRALKSVVEMSGLD
jgi:hypothetical protein